MSPGVTSLHMPKLIGRLNQVHYIPVYDVNRERRKVKHDSDFSWINYLAENSRNKKQNQDEILSTYVGVRQPLQIAKFEARYESPKLNPPFDSQIDKKSETKSFIQKLSKPEYNNKETNKMKPKRVKLVKLVEVDTTTSNASPNSTFHLPQIMKSFIPTTNPRNQQRNQNRSSWTDLTSQRKVKQVSRLDYKPAVKNGPTPGKVTLFTVNYDHQPPPRLQRRPLPPLNHPMANKSFHPGQDAPLWLPAESHLSKSRNMNLSKNGDKRIPKSEEVKTKPMEDLLSKLEKARKLNFPSDELKRMAARADDSSFWESSSKHKVIRSRRRRRHESDRHFGNVKTGVVFNKLPSDLIGSYEKTFQNLEYYLGRVEDAKKRSSSDANILHIPTGRFGDNYKSRDDSEVDQDMTSHYFMRRMNDSKKDVTIRYAHGSSNDTPPLDELPWEDPANQKPQRIQAKEIKYNNDVDARQKVVKHLTINMPKVPPPSPEYRGGRPRSRGKRRRTTLHNDSCRCCGNASMKKAIVTIEKSPEPSNRLPVLVENQTSQPDVAMTSQPSNVYHFSKFETKIETDLRLQQPTMLHATEKVPVKLKSKKQLADEFMVPHGAKKRAHKCSRKEVVIAPFKVSIDESNKSGMTSSTTQGVSSFSKTTITKPFTFSYMPSATTDKTKEKKRKIKLLEESSQKSTSSDKLKQQKPSPTICNENGSKVNPGLKSRPSKSSLVSSFIPANQSQLIYQALVCNSEDKTETVGDYSLDKATDCDGIGNSITLSKNNKLKDEKESEEILLSPHDSFLSKRDSATAP